MEQHVMQTHNKKHVHEHYQQMQQQVHQQVSLKHGMEQPGIQQHEHGEKTTAIVILIVIQIIHGTQQQVHVKQIQNHVQSQMEHEHVYGMNQTKHGEHVA